MDTILNIFKTDDANHYSLHHGKKFNKMTYNSNSNSKSNKNWFDNLNVKNKYVVQKIIIAYF